MSEGAPDPERMTRAGYVDLAIELSQRPERFLFPGIDDDAYAKIKAGEEEDPGYATPIDILLERFVQHGMKIVLGKNPQSGNVFILPGDSNNIEEDSLFPRQLKPHNVVDQKLKKLIVANKKPFL